MGDNPHLACPFEDCGSSDAFNWNDGGYGFCHSCGESYPAKRGKKVFDWAKEDYPVIERVKPMDIPVTGVTYKDIRGLDETSVNCTVYRYRQVRVAYQYDTHISTHTRSSIVTIMTSLIRG